MLMQDTWSEIFPLSLNNKVPVCQKVRLFLDGFLITEIQPEILLLILTISQITSRHFSHLCTSTLRPKISFLEF